MVKETLIGAALDLFMGLAAFAAVFGLVKLGNLEYHQIAAGVAVIYFLAGLVRPDRGDLPLVLRVILISLFGCGGTLMMVGGIITLWAPYAVTALLFSAIGILVRRSSYCHPTYSIILTTPTRQHKRHQTISRGSG